MPKGREYRKQRELREETVKDEVLTPPDSGMETPHVVTVSKEISTKKEEEVLALAKKPFVVIGDEFEVAEVGKIKIMDMAYEVETKIPGPLVVDGKPTIESKLTRVKCSSTEDVEPDFLPLVLITYKVPPIGRVKEQFKMIPLVNFYKLIIDVKD